MARVASIVRLTGASAAVASPSAPTNGAAVPTAPAARKCRRLMCGTTELPELSSRGICALRYVNGANDVDPGRFPNLDGLVEMLPRSDAPEKDAPTRGLPIRRGKPVSVPAPILTHCSGEPLKNGKRY